MFRDFVSFVFKQRFFKIQKYQKEKETKKENEKDTKKKVIFVCYLFVIIII